MKLRDVAAMKLRDVAPSRACLGPDEGIIVDDSGAEHRCCPLSADGLFKFLAVLGVIETLSFLLDAVMLVGFVVLGSGGPSGQQPKPGWAMVAELLSTVVNVVALGLAVTLLPTVCCINKEEAWFKPISRWLNLADGIMICVHMVNIVMWMVINHSYLWWGRSILSTISLMCWAVLFCKTRMTTMSPPMRDEMG